VLDDLGLQIQSGSLPATLATRIVGRDVRYVAQTGSTNHDLRLLARAGAEEGLVLVTDEQTQGRGRRGRTWSAPPGSSLLSSTLLRPTWLPPSDAFYLTILAAVACAEAVEEVTSLRAGLKWPNDLQVQERKLGGILVETEVTDNLLTWAILGIGLNVDWDIASVPELAPTATTLASALGRPISRLHLLTALIRHLDDRYTRLRAGERHRLFEDWRARLTTLGHAVRAESAGSAIEGYAEAVTPDGSLVVRDHAGTRHELTAGDVTVRSQ
jgi:BirA family biotin operon repressor/biotin-[acetyl-CoA-carboxylase] ligase